MKKMISLAVVMVMALGASAALAAQTPIMDEWAQPVMVEGAKGAEVQAYQKADFEGQCLRTGVGGEIDAVFDAVTKWTPIPDFRDAGGMSGPDYLNQF